MTPILMVSQALIAALTIFIAWGLDAPIANFALVFGGAMLGHVLTEALNFVEDDTKE